MKKLFLFLGLLGLFSSDLFSMKRCRDESTFQVEEPQTKKIKRDSSAEQSEIPQPWYKVNIFLKLQKRELYGKKISFTFNEKRLLLKRILLSCAYDILGKIKNYLKIDPSEKEFIKASNEFLSRWKKSFCDDGAFYEDLFERGKLDLSSGYYKDSGSLDEDFEPLDYGPLFVLQPFTKYAAVQRDELGRINCYHFDTLKHFILESVIDEIEFLDLPVKELCLMGNYLMNFPLYIFKLEGLKKWDEFWQYFNTRAPYNWTEKFRDNYKKEKQEFFTKLKAFDEKIKKEEGLPFNQTQYDPWFNDEEEEDDSGSDDSDDEIDDFIAVIFGAIDSSNEVVDSFNESEDDE